MTVLVLKDHFLEFTKYFPELTGYFDETFNELRGYFFEEYHLLFKILPGAYLGLTDHFPKSCCVFF